MLFIVVHHATTQQNNLVASQSAKLNSRKAGWPGAAEYVGTAKNVGHTFTTLYHHVRDTNWGIRSKRGTVTTMPKQCWVKQLGTA